MPGYLLDTQAFLWFAAGKRLPPQVKQIVTDPDNRILLSSSSVFEIATKHALGKLDLDPRLIPMIRQSLQIEPLMIGEDHAIEVAALPHIHKDPFERILVAQARVESLTLLTSDPEIHKYPVMWLWA